MSYGKAGELLVLALDIASRHGGMTMREIDARWESGSPDARRRRSQRAVGELRMLFPDALEDEQEAGGKRIAMARARLADLPAVGSRDIAALERCVQAARQHGDPAEAERLGRVLSAVRGLLPPRSRAKAETDIEALLQTHSLATRPGPQPLHDPAVMEPLSDALLAMRQVSFRYGSDGRLRVAHPYGLLTGYRAYLVAAEGTKPHSLWRLDRMSGVTVLPEASQVPEDFSLAQFARRSFGVYQRDEEYGETVWRFAPQAAAQASGYRFHPDQTVEVQPDGSLLVRFHACGHLEMAWFLYQWGDAVEVLEPPALRAMVEGHRRSDFPGLP